MKGVLSVKLWRSASQYWLDTLNGVKIYGLFKFWNTSPYKRNCLQYWSKQSFIQALICLLTLEKSQNVFIVDDVVCPPGN